MRRLQLLFFVSMSGLLPHTYALAAQKPLSSAHIAATFTPPPVGLIKRLWHRAFGSQPPTPGPEALKSSAAQQTTSQSSSSDVVVQFPPRPSGAAAAAAGLSVGTRRIAFIAPEVAIPQQTLVVTIPPPPQPGMRMPGLPYSPQSPAIPPVAPPPSGMGDAAGAYAAFTIAPRIDHLSASVSQIATALPATAAVAGVAINGAATTLSSAVVTSTDNVRRATDGLATASRNAVAAITHHGNRWRSFFSRGIGVAVIAPSSAYFIKKGLDLRTKGINLKTLALQETNATKCKAQLEAAEFKIAEGKKMIFSGCVGCAASLGILFGPSLWKTYRNG